MDEAISFAAVKLNATVGGHDSQQYPTAEYGILSYLEPLAAGAVGRFLLEHSEPFAVLCGCLHRSIPDAVRVTAVVASKLSQ